MASALTFKCCESARIVLVSGTGIRLGASAIEIPFCTYMLILNQESITWYSNAKTSYLLSPAGIPAIASLVLLALAVTPHLKVAVLRLAAPVATAHSTFGAGFAV